MIFVFAISKTCYGHRAAQQRKVKKPGSMDLMSRHLLER
jgi:hypothetical protein